MTMVQRVDVDAASVAGTTVVFTSVFKKGGFCHPSQADAAWSGESDSEVASTRRFPCGTIDTLHKAHQDQ